MIKDMLERNKLKRGKDVLILNIPLENGVNANLVRKDFNTKKDNSILFLRLVTPTGSTYFYLDEACIVLDAVLNINQN